MANKRIDQFPAIPSKDPDFPLAIQQPAGTTYQDTANNIASCYFKSVETASDYLSAGESVITVTDFSAARTVTLSGADFAATRRITVKAEGAGVLGNGLNIAAQAPGVFEGGQPGYQIRIQGGSLTFWSDGSVWRVLGPPGGGAGVMAQTVNNNISEGASFHTFRARESAGAYAAVAPGDTLFEMFIGSYGGAGGSTNFFPSAALTWIAGDLVSPSGVSSIFTWQQLNDSGAYSPILEFISSRSLLRFPSPVAFASIPVNADADTSGATFVFVNNTAAPRTVTLTSQQCFEGVPVVIKDATGGAGTNNITVATEGAELIDGSATAVISAGYGVLRVVSDGTNWFTF